MQIDEVVVSFTASGSVADYPAAKQAELAATFAEKAAIPVSDVLISVVAASVKITATLTASRAASTTSMMASLSTVLGNTTAASSFLGITVETAPALVVSRRFVKLGGNDNTAVIIGLAVGIPAGLALLAAAAFMLKKSTKAPSKSSKVQDANTSSTSSTSVS